MRARCAGSTRWSAPPPRWDSTVARIQNVIYSATTEKLSAPRPFRVESARAGVGGTEGRLRECIPVWQPERGRAARLQYRASPWRPRSRPTRSWLRFRASVDDIWRWNIRLRRPRWCGWRRGRPTAAAAGGGARGPWRRQVHAALSSAGRVRRASLWDQPGARSSTAFSCSSSGRPAPAGRSRPGRAWRHAPVYARHAGANAPCAGPGRRRPPPTVRRPSSSRSPIGWAAGCTHDHHSPQPPGTSSRFSTTPVAVAEDADPTWHGEPPHEATSSGRLRCSPFVTRSSGRCSRFTPSCRAARSSSTRSWLRTRSRRSPKRAPSSCSVGGSRRAARWQPPAATSCGTR